MRKSSKQSITPAQRQQLIGLFLVGRNLDNQLDAIRKTALGITGELEFDGKPETHGCTADYLYSGNGKIEDNVDTVLELLGLSVCEAIPDPDDFLGTMRFTLEALEKGTTEETTAVIDLAVAAAARNDLRQEALLEVLRQAQEPGGVSRLAIQHVKTMLTDDWTGDRGPLDVLSDTASNDQENAPE